MKTLRLFITGILFATALPCYAQDIITLKNGDEIKAKVTEISSTEIKYKRFENLEGPTVVISKADVFTIKYENGFREVINSLGNSTSNQETASVISKQSDPAGNEKKNHVGIYVNPIGFLTFGPIAGAEFTFNKFILDAHLHFPTLGLLMPLFGGENSDFDNTSVSGGIGFGLGVKYFAAKPRGGLYVGGFLEHMSITYEYDNNTSWADCKEFILGSNIGYKFLFKSGLYLRLGGYFGLAYTYSDDYYNGYYYSDESGDVTVFGMLDFALGFRF